MGLEWADEQTLRWPIQDLQPWANRAASDGPMKGQCIRAIWVLISVLLKKVMHCLVAVAFFGTPCIVLKV